jgi:hypothetical protein
MSWSTLRSLFERYGRWALLLAGTLAIGWLVHSVGFHRVLEVLASAGPLLPLIFVLEASWVLCEGVGFLVLLGPDVRRLPLRVWYQGTLAHYVTMTILPVGRAGAEVVRGTMWGPFVGRSEAASSAALFQAAALFGNALISLTCAGFAACRSAPLLTSVLFGNAAVTGVLGVMIYLGLARAQKLTQFKLLKRFASFGDDIVEGFRRSRPRHVSALAVVTAGRLVQTVEFGVIMLAVSGSLSWEKMFLAEGIHLIGAGLGDMVPNQVGVQEGAYRAFAPALGFGAEPEKAIAVALLARFAVLGVAATSGLLLQLLPGRGLKSTLEPEPVSDAG